LRMLRGVKFYWYCGYAAALCPPDR